MLIHQSQCVRATQQWRHCQSLWSPQDSGSVFRGNARDEEFYDTYEGTKRVPAKSGIYTFREHFNKKKVWEEHRPISWASRWYEDMKTVKESPGRSRDAESNHTNSDSKDFAPNPKSVSQCWDQATSLLDIQVSRAAWLARPVWRICLRWRGHLLLAVG